jgi:6-phosphogluconolactonase
MLPYTPDAVADALLGHLDAAAAERGWATLAIPGGRSPGPVLTALAKHLSPFLRERLHLLWVDERAVPIGHADRNDLPTLAAWQAGGPLPAHVHPMPAEAPDLTAAAQAYATTLATATRGGPLDAALIGIGEDGHFASLFPQHPGLRDLDPVFAVVDSPKPPAARLTLSLPVLSQTTLRIVLALGAAKGAVHTAARSGPDPRWPISLLPASGTVWYLDDAAVAATRPA